LTSPKRRRREGGLHINPPVKSRVDVVDVRHLIVKGRGHVDVRLQPLKEPVLADLDHGGVAAQNHGGVVQVADVNLRKASADVGPPVQRDDHPCGQLRARLIRGGASAARRRSEAVDNRQIEIGVLGSELIDDRSRLVDEIRISRDATDADGPPPAPTATPAAAGATDPDR
jgi:hypothetical protein